MSIRNLPFALISLVAFVVVFATAPAPIYGHSHEVADAAPLSVGVEHAINGELTEEDAGTDWYSFTASAGQNYIVELKPTIALTRHDDHPSDDHPALAHGHLVDPSILEILDEEHTQLVGEKDGGGILPNSARASFTPEEGGIHYIAVGAGAQDRTGTGGYTISIRADDHADDYRTVSDAILRPGDSVTATIDSDVAPGDERSNRWDWIVIDRPNADGLRPHPGVESLDDRDVIRVEFPEGGWYRFDVLDAPAGVGIWHIWREDGDLNTYVVADPLTSIEDYFFSGTLYVEIGTPHASEGNTGTYTLSLTTVVPDS